MLFPVFPQWSNVTKYICYNKVRKLQYKVLILYLSIYIFCDFTPTSLHSVGRYCIFSSITFIW